MSGIVGWLPGASALVAIAAAIIAVWNVRRSAFNADRQHAIALASDIAKWGVCVLSDYRKIPEIFDRRPEATGRADQAIDLANNLILRIDEAALLFPSANNRALEKVSEAVQFLAQDRDLILSGKLEAKDAGKYAENRTSLIAALRDEIGVTRRHADAKRYLI